MLAKGKRIFYYLKNRLDEYDVSLIYVHNIFFKNKV